MDRPIPRARQARVLAATLLVVVLGTQTVDAEPPAAYRARWHAPGIQERIARNIEAHRKGDATVRIVDRSGRPVPGARVEASLSRHEFLFGCNAFVLGQLDSPELNQKYEAAFVRLFNFATVPFYWEGTEPSQGELRYGEPARDVWRRPPPERFLPWAQAHGLTLKGHPLLWHAYNPPWLPQDPEALRALYRKRFREIAGRFGTSIPIWDVVNESQVCPKSYPLYTPDRDYVRWAFEEVAPLFPPTTTLTLNEVTTPFNFLPAEANPFFAQVKSLLAQGAAVRAIGLQYHYFRREHLDAFLADPKCDPARLLDVYEQFGQFGLPLFITEITIPSAGADGEALQAEVVRDHYRLWFAAPRMAGITWWNLGDGTAVKGENEAKGGLLDAALDPKPAYRELDRLINQEWTTRAALETDRDGRASFRGFHGTYALRVTVAGKTHEASLELRSGSKPEVVTLSLD